MRRLQSLTPPGLELTLRLIIHPSLIGGTMELSDQSETRSRYGVHINPAEKKQQNPVQNTIENVMG